MTDQEDTDPGGHGPVPPPPDLLEAMMRRVMREELGELRRDLARERAERERHEKAEMEFHAEVRRRLEELEAREDA